MQEVHHAESVEYNNDNLRHKNDAIIEKNSSFDSTSSPRHYIRANKKSNERTQIRREMWARGTTGDAVDVVENRRRTHFLVRCQGDEPEEQLECLRDIMSISGHGVEITRYLETTPFFAVDLPDGESQVEELQGKKNVVYVEEDLSNHYSFEYVGTMESRWDSLGERRELRGDRARADDRAEAEDRDGGRDDGRDRSGQGDDNQDDEVGKEIEKDYTDKDSDKENDKEKDSDANVASIFADNSSRNNQQLTYGVNELRATEVWEEFKDIVGEDLAKGSGAKVCIIDTGARASHEDVIEGTDGSNNMGKDLNWVRFAVSYRYRCCCELYFAFSGS